MQLCKKLEVGMLLLALFYLFSPLVSVSKTCFFQGVKAGDMIFILGHGVLQKKNLWFLNCRE